MNIFIDRFLLGVLVLLFGGLLTNPVGFSTTVVIIGILVTFVLAAIISWFSAKYKEIPKITVEPSHPA
jgi:hypothetical protein